MEITKVGFTWGRDLLGDETGVFPGTPYLIEKEKGDRFIFHVLIDK